MKTFSPLRAFHSQSLQTNILISVLNFNAHIFPKTVDLNLFLARQLQRNSILSSCRTKEKKKSSIFAWRSNKNTSPCFLQKRYIYKIRIRRAEVLMIFTKTMIIYVILAKQYSFKQPRRYNYLVTVQIAMKIKLAFLSFANYIIKDIWKREEKIFFQRYLRQLLCWRLTEHSSRQA